MFRSLFRSLIRSLFRLFCRLGLHSWTYWDNGKEYWRVCSCCKVEDYTRPAFYLWHRIEKDCWIYKDPDWILDQPDRY